VTRPDDTQTAFKKPQEEIRRTRRTNGAALDWKKEAGDESVKVFTFTLSSRSWKL
jgi:hypothetical protein